MLEKTKKRAETVIPYNGGDTQLARIRISVVGISPLMTHNPQSMGVEVAPGKGSRIPDAETEAEAGCYRMEDGTLAIKGESFRGALLGAAGAWKAKAKKTMRSILSHIVVVEELVQLHHPDGELLTSYVIDARRAIVQRQGIIRRRPRFENWACSFTMEYDQQICPEPKLIVDVCADGGGRMGVGDFRPQKNGPYGRFVVREYSLLS